MASQRFSLTLPQSRTVERERAKRKGLNTVYLSSESCSNLPVNERCEADLPDNPQCAPNYHFGMLLGVEDFRADQGFHVGRLRRHQRLLHGSGVVAGFYTKWDGATFELRVKPGYAIDSLGRDLWLESARCVNLALWWGSHCKDDSFKDIEPGITLFDLDIVVCYANCLDRPVPAIAEPCAGNSADIAHSRICETVTLKLVRHRDDDSALSHHSHHLLRMWLGLEEAVLNEETGKLLDDDQWLIDASAAMQALPAAQQNAARAKLVREIVARSSAAESPLPPELEPGEDACLIVARLKDVMVSADGENWRIGIGELQMGARDTLPPTFLMQNLLLSDAKSVGPELLPNGANLSGNLLTLVFNQPLAAASVSATAFSVNTFDATTGWQVATFAAPSYDEGNAVGPTVTLTLDSVPSGDLLRITVFGTDSTPLLGKNLIPTGALHAGSDGRNLTITLSI